jgi:hypothetical protein
MARLNAELKQAKLGVTVVFFIISSRGTKSLNPLALEKRGVLAELDDVCERIVEGVGEKLFRRAAAGGKLRIDDLVDEYWALRYRRTQHALRQNFLPMITTHMLEDDAKDPVLNHIRTLGLFNREDDPVKIVYHPDFINPANPLWGIEYDQFVRGCHLGIFPSAYEPWGYTPLECLAMGVPAVTSDLAGFGRFTHENFPDHDSWGLQVLPRRGRGFFDASGDLAWRLLQFCKLERRDRIALRNLTASLPFAFALAAGDGAVRTGADVLIATDPSPLRGKRIGLVTNPTGVTRSLEPLPAALRSVEGLQLVALYGPEHGVRGNAQAGDKVGFQWDPVLRLPLFSLYGKTFKPTGAMLTNTAGMVRGAEGFPTNATVAGQTTAHYITDRLQSFGLKISRLAYGVPMGGELDYLDEGTLTTALSGRRPF